MTHRYIGTKEVTAWPQERDGKPGYAVKYADGYISWSPQEAFEDAYRTSEPGMPQALTFGDAIHYLKRGFRVARAGWNGKDMWLSLSGGPRQVHHDQFWSAHNSAYARECGGYATVLPSITMKTATGEILMGWLASQTDMLAEDWMVLA